MGSRACVLRRPHARAPSFVTSSSTSFFLSLLFSHISVVLLKRLVTMSVTSSTSFMSDYTRVADRESVEDEKHMHSRHSSDVESGKQEKRSSRFSIDGRTVSDAIIGLSDGMTVPFALTAGLSALGDTKVVVFGGMAELIAGAISMGLGGYLGAKSEE